MTLIRSHDPRRGSVAGYGEAWYLLGPDTLVGAYFNELQVPRSSAAAPKRTD
ncbi:MAG: hypothetical protein ACLPY2_10115 [Bryobacteraceae bacterium]|jgi:hypothetical protein